MKRATTVGIALVAAMSLTGFITYGGTKSDTVAEKPVHQSETVDKQKPTEKPVEAIKAVERQEQTKLVKVQPGDTLGKIAEREDTTVKRLFNANEELAHPDDIEPGDELRVPEHDEKLEDRYTKLMERLAAEEAERKRQAEIARQEAQQQEATRQHITAPAPEPVSVTGGVWDDLAACESGGNWTINTGNGYYGGLQFSLSSWQAVGGSGYPHQASKSEQIRRGEILQQRQGWDAWPSCAKKLGLT